MSASIILLIATVLLLLLQECFTYSVPDPKVRVLSPKGFEVSIPDEAGIRLFVFNGQKNQPLGANRTGTIRGSVVTATNGRWTYRNDKLILGAGDVLHYWLHVQHENLAYRLYDRQYSVSGATSTSFATDTSACAATMTKIDGQNPCSGSVVFDENFTNLLAWKPEIRIPLDTDEAEFVSYQFQRDVCSISGGQFRIQPQFRNDLDRIENGILDLRSQCTSSETAGCYREAFSYRILPPIESCQISTRDTFTFKYGRVEIRAKLPKGDWIYPDICIERAGDKSIANHNIDHIKVASIHGNVRLSTQDGVEIGGQVLYGGIVNAGGYQLTNRSMPAHLADAYHVYSLEWTDSQIRLGIDAEIYGTISTKTLPFDDKYFLKIGVGVGGIANFPDESRTGGGIQKPWKNDDPKAELNFWRDYSNWFGTWTPQDSRLQVDYVRVYAI